MNQQKQKSNLVAIITMFFMFAMISFVTNLAAPFGTIWKNEYAGSNTLGMMGNMMNFLAYLFMGIPAGNLLVRIGYKKTALWALGVGFVGLLTQYISSKVGADASMFTFSGFDIKLNFIIYLLGAFICGICVCMLNTVVNPMLNLLGGGGNKGNQLIQAGGALNSLSGTLTPFFVGALIGTVTKETSMSTVAPMLFIAMGVFVAAFVIISMVSIPEPHLRKEGVLKEKFSHSPWSFRHTTLGVIGIFIYVGIEIGIPGTLNFYLSDAGANGAGILHGGAAIGGAIVAIYWLLMLVGRSASSAISGKISSRVQLIAVSSVAIVLVVAAICTPKSVTVPVPSFIKVEVKAEKNKENNEKIAQNTACDKKKECEKSEGCAKECEKAEVACEKKCDNATACEKSCDKECEKVATTCEKTCDKECEKVATTCDKTCEKDCEKAAVAATEDKSKDQPVGEPRVPISAIFLILCGLCTSIMWGGIFNLAVEGLGKYTAQASGIFMMMVVGGGVLPLVQQGISDVVGYMASYWLIVASLAYLLFYGLVGCKNVNKDIPVE